MAKLNQIDSSKLITLDPFQRDLDVPIMRYVKSTEPLVVDGDDVALFLEWAARPTWQSAFESNLQGLAERDGYPLLTACLPLVTFRYEFCSGGRSAQGSALSKLMDRLVVGTHGWRDLGVDTVAISCYAL